MKKQNAPTLLLISILFLSACSSPTPEPTQTPAPTATSTATTVPTETPVPTSTPKPTETPDMVATQVYEMLNAEIQDFYGKGYLGTTEGEFKFYNDFEADWAQLGWYDMWGLGEDASDFVFSGHFAWETAVRSWDFSGCGFVFGVQENGDHFAVFLDQNRIIFVYSDRSKGQGAREVGTSAGTGRVKFDNPAEADFTLVVHGEKAYIEVDGEFIGEYSFPTDTKTEGPVAVSILSGTNKDYGTRCEISDMYLWLPNN